MKKLLVILFIFLFYNISYGINDNSEKVTYGVVSYSTILENPNSKFEDESKKYILVFKTNLLETLGREGFNKYKAKNGFYGPETFNVFLSDSQRKIIESLTKTNDKILIGVKMKNISLIGSSNLETEYYLDYFDKIVNDGFIFKGYKKDELLNLIDETQGDIEIQTNSNYSYFLNKEDGKKYIENLLTNGECVLGASNQTKKNTSISRKLLLSDQGSCDEIPVLYYTGEKGKIGIKLYTDSYREKLNLENNNNSKKYIENVISYQFKGDKLYYIGYDKEQSKYYVSLNGDKKLYDEVGSLNVSDNGKNYSYLVNKGDKSYIVIGGEDIPNQEIQINGYIIETKISPDGKNIFHIVQIGNEYVKIFKNGKEILKVPNSRQTDDQSIIISSFAFLSNNSYVFIYKKNGNFYLSKDSKDIGNYSLVYNTKKIITNGNNYIFKAQKNGKEFVVYNGVEQKKYDYVGDPIFSENNSYLYLAKSSGKSFVVVNQVEGKKYDEIVYNENFYHDNPRFINNLPIYIAKNNGKYFVVNNQTEGKSYQSIKSLTISKNGIGLAYIVEEDGKTFVVFNGNEGKKYNDRIFSYGKDWIDTPGFGMLEISQDGKSLTYVVTNDFNSKNTSKWIVVKDEVESQNMYYDIFDTTYLKNGDSISIVSKNKDNKEICILTNLASKCYSGINKYEYLKEGHYGNINGKLLFSPDGNNYAFISQNTVISTNFGTGNIYDSVGNLQYSSNGRHLYYTAKSNGKLYILKDNKEVDVIDGNGYDVRKLDLINNTLILDVLASEKTYLFQYDIGDDKYLKTLKDKLISSKKGSIISVIDKYVSKNSKTNLNILKEKLSKVNKTVKNKDIIEYFEASIDSKLSQ